MEKTYTINNYDNHLIIEDNGKTLLVDTGSPFSIFDGAALDFCGSILSHLLFFFRAITHLLLIPHS